MQGEYSSADGEAARVAGCLSIFLWPPFSAAVFGLLIFLALIHIPIQLDATIPDHMAADGNSNSIASFFTPEVRHWEFELMAWAAQQNLDPNLAATVMQIESCGDPFAVSSAGAAGLFQVMPYHFAAGENSFDPGTNAARGLNYLKRSLENFTGDAGMALAGYNGGINGASRPPDQWAQETRDYKYWGERIYADALAGSSDSHTLNDWLDAGGASLCAQAAQRVAESH